MLILCRKIGERIVIDNHTVITVLSISGSQTRLGISAPADVRIRRAEVVARPTNGAGNSPKALPETGPRVAATHEM
jgi:carbon storage regulator